MRAFLHRLVVLDSCRRPRHVDTRSSLMCLLFSRDSSPCRCFSRAKPSRLLKSSYQIFYLLILTDHPVESLAPTSPFQSRALFVIVPVRVLYLGPDTGLSYRIPRTEVASSFSLRALLVHVPARILHLESNHDMISPMHSFLCVFTLSHQ